MKRLNGTVALCLVAAAMAGCGTAQTAAPSPVAQTPAPAIDTRAQDEAAVRKVADEWGADIAAKRLDEMLSYYTDDAWVHPQGAPIAKTADQRRAVWSAFFATPGVVDTQGETTRVELSKSGDLAIEYGNFSETVKVKKGKDRVITEKYVTAWRKEADGSWKVVADIWNRDK